MADIAALGIAVDTTQVKGADKDLQGMTQSADKASDSTDNLGESSKKLIGTLQDQIRKVQDASKAYGGAGDAISAMVGVQEQFNNVLKEQGNAWQAANDNIKQVHKSFIGMINDVFTLGGHLKSFFTVAYIGSETFRGIVNRSITPALGATKEALKEIAPVAYAAFSAIAKQLGPVIGTLLRFGGPLILVAAAYETIKKSIEAANDKMEEWNKLVERATSSDVSVSYFERLAKGFEGVGSSAEKAAETLKKFREISEPKLGGSEIANRIKELQEAGNFKDNSGVAQFAAARDTQERFEAIVRLITEAQSKGERLAALDIAARFLPEDLLDKLRATPGYLQNILDKAREVKQEDLIDPEVIIKTQEFNSRLDSAYAKIAKLAEPFPSLVTIGLFFKGIWVNIVEAIGNAAEKLNNFLTKLTSFTLPDWLKKLFDVWLGVSPYGGGGKKEDLGPAPLDAFGETNFGVSGADRERQRRRAQERLPDTSKVPQAAAATANEFDRLAKSIERSVAATEAQSQAFGQNVGEQQRLTVTARLTEAAHQDGAKAADGYADKIKKIADRAAEAALAQERARVQSEITFGRRTAFLTQEDVQIATQLKGLYGNDIPAALASTEAAALRTNEALRQISDGLSNALSSGLTDLVTGAKTTKEVFQDMTKAILQSLTQVIIKMLVIGPLMRALGGAFGFTSAGSAGPINLFGGAGPNFPVPTFGSASARGNVFLGPGINAFSNSIVNRPTYFPFASGMGLMGENGPEAIIPLKRGKDGSLGIQSGGSNFSVQVNNYNSDDTSVRVKKDTRNPESERLIIDVVKKAHARGEFDSSNAALYGVRRKKVL